MKLEKLLTFLTNALEKTKFQKDKEKIQYFCKELDKLKNIYQAKKN